VDIEDAVVAEPSRALQFALQMCNRSVLERALELVPFRMDDDFPYLQQAVILKGHKALMKPVLAKVDLRASLQIRYRLWKLARGHRRKVMCYQSQAFGGH
jgi:hypothetical protein